MKNKKKNNNNGSRALEEKCNENKNAHKINNSDIEQRGGKGRREKIEGVLNNKFFSIKFY